MTDSEPPIGIAVAVVEHAGQVLIGQRPPGVPLAGLWEFPGGKIRPGESPEGAAVRECLEETGLAVDVVGAYAVVEHRYNEQSGEDSSQHAAAAFTVRLHFFTCRSRDAEAIPGEPFRWVDVSELDSYQFPAANAALVGELIRRAQGE